MRTPILLLTLLCTVYSSQLLAQSQVDVCEAPYPAMPVLETDMSNYNDLTCFECEVWNTTEVSSKNCKQQRCTGDGGSGPACYRWEFIYKGFKYNNIRTGCSVNCSWVDYTTHMCSGVGEKVFQRCEFSMCKGDLCNSGTTLTPLLSLLSLLTLQLFI